MDNFPSFEPPIFNLLHLQESLRPPKATFMMIIMNKGVSFDESIIKYTDSQLFFSLLFCVLLTCHKIVTLQSASFY